MTTGHACAGPDRVYAGGDVVIEPGSIITACADGRKAAESVCNRLGVPFTPPSWRRSPLSAQDIIDVKAVRAQKIHQFTPTLTPVAGRARFTPIDSTLTDADARREALRCVQCAAFCDKCVEVCPNRSNYTFTMRPVRWTLPVVGADGGGCVVTGSEEFVIAQDRQILHVDDFCNECDNCQTFCVHQGRPYIDKPRLFLDAGLFASEGSNAFHIDGAGGQRRRSGGNREPPHGRRRGTDLEDGMVRREARHRRVAGRRGGPAVASWVGLRSIQQAAEMAVLYDGV